MNLRTPPELDRLIRFAVVAEELSFSRAAARLQLNQPVISRQIQQLEAQLGFPLFARNTRRVRLTGQGEALLTYAREIVQLAERTQRAIDDLNRLHQEKLALGVSASCHWIPARWAVISRFREKHSQSELLVKAGEANLETELQQREIDLALLPWPCESLDFDFDTVVLHRCRPSLLVPAQHPLAGRRFVRMKDVAGRRIVISNPMATPRAHAQQFGPFFDAGAIPVIVPEGRVALGYYALHLSEMMVSLDWPNSECGAPPGFVHVQVSDAHNVEFVLARRKEPPSQLVADFWNLAKEVASQFLPEPVGECAATGLPAVANSNDPAEKESDLAVSVPIGLIERN